MNGSGELDRRFQCRPDATGGRSMKYRCAVLDDYQGVALTMADWTQVSTEVDVEVFRKKISDHAELCRTLKDFQILCLMRERTPIPEELISALPKLRLI